MNEMLRPVYLLHSLKHKDSEPLGQCALSLPLCQPGCQKRTSFPSKGNCIYKERTGCPQMQVGFLQQAVE